MKLSKLRGVRLKLNGSKRRTLADMIEAPLTFSNDATKSFDNSYTFGANKIVNILPLSKIDYMGFHSSPYPDFPSLFPLEAIWVLYNLWHWSQGCHIVGLISWD